MFMVHSTQKNLFFIHFLSVPFPASFPFSTFLWLSFLIFCHFGSMRMHFDLGICYFLLVTNDCEYYWHQKLQEIRQKLVEKVGKKVHFLACKYMLWPKTWNWYFTNLEAIFRWIRTQILYISILPLEPLPPNYKINISISGQPLPPKMLIWYLYTP